MPVFGLDSRSYTVSNAGNITRLADDLVPANSRDFAHDNLDRLVWDSGVSATNPTYSHDANGNRLRREAGAFAEQDFAYLPGSNRQSATQYDGMGNKQESYATYNESGRLGFLSDAVTTDTMVLAYNGLGELARTVMYHPDPCSIEQLLLSRDDYLFLPDGRALATRTFNTASVNTDYVWVDGLPVAQFVDSYDAEDELIGTTLTYLHPDHLGTPRIGTSQGKAITWRYRSDAFGIPDAQTSGVVRLRFPGQISLGVAGVHYNYFRDYEPGEGRYLESDPFGLGAGTNTFSYVDNNALAYSDPSGLCKIEVRTKLAPVPGAKLLGIYHGYLVTTDASGSQKYFRGGPGSGPAIGTGPFGYIRAEYGDYEVETPDWNPEHPGPVTTVLDDGEPCDCYNESFSNTLDNINASGIPYLFGIANSNSVFNTALRQSGFYIDPLPVRVPGFGTDLSRLHDYVSIAKPGRP